MRRKQVDGGVLDPSGGHSGVWIEPRSPPPSRESLSRAMGGISGTRPRSPRASATTPGRARAMRFLKRTMGLGLLGAVLLSTFAGFVQPAAADVEVYFNPPGYYVAPAPAPYGWYRYEPRYYYYDRGGYYGGGYDGGHWRHDGYRWRWEQGYWGR